MQMHRYRLLLSPPHSPDIQAVTYRVTNTEGKYSMVANSTVHFWTSYTYR
jgi:hypothetical protein